MIDSYVSIHGKILHYLISISFLYRCCSTFSYIIVLSRII